MRALLFKGGTARTRALYVALIVVSVIYIARLWDLQIMRHSYFNEVAAAEHEKKFEISSDRGVIYMKDGSETVPLVLNETLYTVFADPRYVEDIDKTAEEIAAIVGGDVNQYKDQLNKKDSVYQVLAKRVSKDNATKLEEKGLLGVGTKEQTYRVYPEGQLASQLLGFVNDEGDGQYGIEEYLNEQLKGEYGLLKAVTDVRGVPLPTDDDNVLKNPEDGDAVTLTIDRNVQQFVEQALAAGVQRSKAPSGSAIVINPNNGQIVAMANYPTYDPNKYRDVTDYNVFQNTAVTGAYETGSGMKVFTMATGLNEGKVTKDSAFQDTGRVEVDGETIENAGNLVCGNCTMTAVIQRSVNTGVVHVLKQLGGGEINEGARKTLYSYFTEKFGFGSTTGIEQTGEPEGTLVDPSDPNGANIRYANMTFGQGMTVTMVQMVAAYSSLINGGTYYQPTLIAARGEDGEQQEMAPNAVRQNMLSENTLASIKEMMVAVVQGGGGTSAKRPGYIIGGKTGTAQIPDEFGRYTEKREIGSFIGFGGGAKPEYVIMVRVNEPQIAGYAGSAAAAPIFAEISNYLIDYYQIPPVN